jgi:hypothetical protein
LANLGAKAEVGKLYSENSGVSLVSFLAGAWRDLTVRFILQVII